MKKKTYDTYINILDIDIQIFKLKMAGLRPILIVSKGTGDLACYVRNTSIQKHKPFVMMMKFTL